MLPNKERLLQAIDNLYFSAPDKPYFVNPLFMDNFLKSKHDSVGDDKSIKFYDNSSTGMNAF